MFFRTDIQMVRKMFFPDPELAEKKHPPAED
jgi:hypothetical protein